MKALTIIVTSVLVSGLAMTSAHAMGKADSEYNSFMMKMADVNTDGKMSKDEFMKMSASMAAKEFAMMDMDDDGSISATEFNMHNR